jgi:hypothetical protein
VIDPQSQALLQQTFRRESLSMLRYVGEAFPWTTADGGPALQRVRDIEAEDREATASLGRFLFRRHIAPSYTGSYPSNFTTINFLALGYLLPRIIDGQRKALADLERDTAAVTDADARAELEKLLAVKREHLAELEALNVPKGEATKV